MAPATAARQPRSSITARDLRRRLWLCESLLLGATVVISCAWTLWLPFDDGQPGEPAHIAGEHQRDRD